MKPLLFLAFFVLCLQMNAQDTFLQESNPQAKQEAIRLGEEYNKQLAFTGKQRLLFEKKVEEFLIRRQKIEQEFKGREKLEMLYKLQERETKEMNDILTHAQLQLYKKIKPEFQPLETVYQE